MKRLVFIVEGDTEVIFVEKIIVPYLYSLGIRNPINAQTIITNRRQHKKGGVGSYGKFKNEITRTLAQKNVLVTTLIDFYKLPTDFPAFTKDANKIDAVEAAIKADFDDNPDFIPYLQQHELEALMFAARDGFELVIDDVSQLAEIDTILKEYPNPEDINHGEETAPSKRMQRIFNYDKTGDSELIFEMLGIEIILEKCPRFRHWITTLIKVLDQD